MAETISLDEAIEVVERLDDDAQARLVEVVRSRLEERRRANLVERVAVARRELAAGLGLELTMEEFLSELDK